VLLLPPIPSATTARPSSTTTAALSSLLERTCPTSLRAAPSVIGVRYTTERSGEASEEGMR
jgi:hypothetical protein